MRSLKYFSLAGALMILTFSTFAAAPGGGSSNGGGPCTVSYNPGDTFLTILPPNCEYKSNAPHIGQSQVPEHLKVRHSGFLSRAVGPGGSLNGYLETFESTLHVEVAGAIAEVPATVAVSTAAFEDSQPFVSFATSMDRLEGEIVGDSVFEYFSIRAGSELVGDSPGQTTISADWDKGTAVVDSFFRIAYEIEFQGAVGGPLEGQGGVFTGTVTMEAFGD